MAVPPAGLWQYDGVASALVIVKKKRNPPNTDPQLGVGVRGLLLCDKDDVVFRGLAVDVHSVVVAAEHADDVRFARLLIQNRRIGALVINVVLVISEGDSEAAVLGMTDDIIDDGLIEAVNVVDELTECDTVDEGDRNEVSYNDTSLLQ